MKVYRAKIGDSSQWFTHLSGARKYLSENAGSAEGQVEEVVITLGKENVVSMLNRDSIKARSKVVRDFHGPVEIEL